MEERDYVNGTSQYGYYGNMPMQMDAGVRMPVGRIGHHGPAHMVHPPMAGQIPVGLLPHPSVNFNMPRLAYRFKAQPPPPSLEPDGYGRRMRRGASQARKQVDVTSSLLNYIERRIWDDRTRHGSFVSQPHVLYAPETYPIRCFRENSAECVMTRLIRSAVNKIKCPIFDLCWTPEGRRLITGGSSGEFTLWNGTAFNFETILQAHDSAVRAMEWSHNQDWMITSDQDGYVKYWQANMNNVAMFQAHREAVRGLSFGPSDLKFVTGGDDSTARIWDFKTLTEERALRGHGSDVRAVDWHPKKGLVVTGSRDSQQPVKLWDPRVETCVRTLHFHKSGVTTATFNANGNWLLTGSRDHLIKLIDIRSMSEVFTFKGHVKDVTSIAWHPIQEKVFVSGGADGALIYWDTLSDRELTFIEGAHEQAIWALAWHPLGHILASGSNDNNTKFWTRNKPGDLLDDFYTAPQLLYDHSVRLSELGSEKPPNHHPRKPNTIVAKSAAYRSGPREETSNKIPGIRDPHNLQPLSPEIMIPSDDVMIGREFGQPRKDPNIMAMEMNSAYQAHCPNELQQFAGYTWSVGGNSETESRKPKMPLLRPPNADAEAMQIAPEQVMFVQGIQRYPLLLPPVNVPNSMAPADPSPETAPPVQDTFVDHFGSPHQHNAFIQTFDQSDAYATDEPYVPAPAKYVRFC